MRIRVVLVIITILLAGGLLALAHLEISQAESNSGGDDNGGAESDDSDSDTDDSDSDTDRVDDDKPDSNEENNSESDNNVDGDNEPGSDEDNDSESDSDIDDDDGADSDIDNDDEADSDVDNDDEANSDEDDDSDVDDNKPENTEESNMSSMLIIYDNSVKYNLVRLMGNYATALGIPVLEKRIDYDSKYFPGTFPDDTIDIEYIVIFSKDITGLNVIIDYVTSYGSLNDKKIIISSDIGEKVLKQHALILQKAASPEYLIITDLKDSDLVWDAILTSSVQNTPVTEILDEKGIEFSKVDTEDLETIHNYEKIKVDTMIKVSESNIPLETLKIILILPFAATIVAIFRNVIGLQTYGVFGPAIMSIAFLSSGLIIGLILFGVLLITGVFVRKYIERLNLMLVPRLAVLLTLCCIIIAALITIGIKTGNQSLATITVFPLIIMSIIIENFMKTTVEKGIKDALKISLSTLFVALICFIVISQSTLQAVVMTHPEILLLVVGFNLLLGRWKGLRMVEYLRFSRLMKG